MYLTRREKDAIISGIALVALMGGITIGALCEAASFQKEQNTTISSEVGFDVIDVQEAELSQVNENFKAKIICTNKETKEKLIVEYALTATDFIVMNQPEYNPWEYLSMYVIPHQSPTFVGSEKEYKEYTQNIPTKQLGE